MFTNTVAEAWEDYSKNHQAQITAAFKRCGMYNDINGLENHLVQLEKGFPYEVPSKDSPPALVAKKKQKYEKKKKPVKKRKRKRKAKPAKKEPKKKKAKRRRKSNKRS